jgi:hypothetical protein
MQTLLPEVALPRPQSKAEGVAVLGVAADRVRVLVLFEDVSKDLPVEYALILPDR